MKKIILGAALVVILSGCGTTTDTMDVSGTITEKEFEMGSTSCTMYAFKAPGKPAPPPPAPKPVVKAPVVAPVKPVATGGAAKPAATGAPVSVVKPVATGYRPAQGPIPTKSYKARSYVVYPIIGSSNRCYRADCWEIEFQTDDWQTFDVCVSKEVYDAYDVGDTFPERG